MKKLIKFKRLILLLVLVLPPAWCSATIFHSIDGNNAIQIIESNVQSAPKGSTIQASIDGHYLTVIFTQDIGTLAMELDKVSGPMIFSYPSVQTPDGYQFYLPLTGDYVITFTLANGDEYYGEFTVTN